MEKEWEIILDKVYQLKHSLSLQTKNLQRLHLQKHLNHGKTEQKEQMNVKLTDNNKNTRKYPIE